MVSSTAKFTGSIVALVTPMHDDGSIDWPSLDALIEWHIASGTNAIVAVGTTGESATLEIPEHLQVISHTVKQVAGRVAVIAGTGANATAEAIHLSLEAQNLGADACLLVTPYYNKPTQEGMYLHFRAIAEAVSIPHILYNVPGRTSVDLLPATVARLAQIDNIVGIKEATGDMARARDILAGCPQDFLLLSGDDATALELVLLGGHGNISVTANVVPAQVAEVCRLARAGEAAAAKDLQNSLMPLHQALFVESNPIPVKWALAHMGKIGPGIRLPMTPLSAHHHDRLAAVVDQFTAAGVPSL